MVSNETDTDGNTIVPMSKISAKGYHKTLTFTGSPIEQPNVTAEYKKSTLDTKKYEVSYTFNQAAGTAYIILTGTGVDTNEDRMVFRGTKTIPFKIAGTVMNKKNITIGSLATQTYTGQPVYPAVTLNGREAMEEGVHYTVTYKRNVGKGTAQMVFEGMESGGYTGSFQIPFKILPALVQNMEAIVSGANLSGNRWQVPYTKGTTTPSWTVVSKMERLLYPEKTIP